MCESNLVELSLMDDGTDPESVKRLQECLMEKDAIINELKQTIEQLKSKILLDDVISEKRIQLNEINKSESCFSLPFEIITMIFFQCDAKTRCRIACINKRTSEELCNWNDVQNLYITRVPLENHDNKTTITHAYQINTDASTVGVIKTARAMLLLKHFRNVKSILVESATEHFLGGCNKIVKEEGFFSLMRNLETVKLCSINDNLSLSYTINDFLSLPNLKTLHIREMLTIIEAPPVDKIVAPIEDLRICTHRVPLQHLVKICRSLANTLRRLELLITIIVPDDLSAIRSRSAAVIGLVEVMTEIVNLTHLTLTRSLLNPSTRTQVYPLLKFFLALKTLTLQSIGLNDIAELVNTHLPQTLERIIISELIGIRSIWYPVNVNLIEFYDIFNDERLPILNDECRKIHGKLTLQFGRFRGLNQPTINLQFGSVKIEASDFGSSVFANRTGLSRVFLWEGRILTRSAYLKLNNIEIEPRM